MPPAAKRPRSYDHAKVVAAVLAQFSHVRAAVGRLTPEQLALPTRLGEWTVRELCAHIAMVAQLAAESLERPEPRTRDLALLDWPFATSTAASAVDEDTRSFAGLGEADELCARTAERIGALLPGSPADRLVPTRFGGMRFGDYLVTRTVELVVHTDDLAAATGLEIPYDRQALAACTRLLADALAVKAPGGSTEVRIPPFAVVQCIEGPRHTRGTPPNTVETDPLTWVRLATGRAVWQEERDAARVRVRGERADLGPLLPLLG
ncbi:maleylpyruvate isomerase family mycothiol-dependent enzyme [Streptomyces sanyensis]|uniref:Maleylpyruvate isomerase family mycothiol-dependent enzyme n=1 Tax=Streptomyces sanyensis TaxID=568869 RepID=A0ABP9BI86_9ACTN